MAQVPRADAAEIIEPGRVRRSDGGGEIMEMLCTKNERVVVAVFHETLDFDDEESEVAYARTAMRQLVEQTRELWSPDVDSNAFRRTVDSLCFRIMGVPVSPPESPRDGYRRPRSL